MDQDLWGTFPASGWICAIKWHILDSFCQKAVWIENFQSLVGFLCEQTVTGSTSFLLPDGDRETQAERAGDHDWSSGCLPWRGWVGLHTRNTSLVQKPCMFHNSSFILTPIFSQNHMFYQSARVATLKQLQQCANAFKLELNCPPSAWKSLDDYILCHMTPRMRKVLSMVLRVSRVLLVGSVQWEWTGLYGNELKIWEIAGYPLTGACFQNYPGYNNDFLNHMDIFFQTLHPVRKYYLDKYSLVSEFD